MNCTNCGAPLEPGDRFCQVCGTLVSENEAAPTQQPVTPTSTGQIPPFSGGTLPSKNEPNTKIIRAWFNVKIPIWPLFVAIYGFILTFSGIFGKAPLVALLGIIIFIASLGFFINKIKNANSGGQHEVDEAWNSQINVISNRALTKLNLIDEQTSLIEPVVTIGYGISPDISFSTSKAAATAKKGLLGSIFGIVFGKLFGKLTKNGTELDPYEAYRIGDDERIRSMLLEVNTYYFTDTQVLLYSADVDISTGLIYHEETSEVFYEDIEGIEFEQELFKVYNSKKKKYINKKRENMVLYLGGCNLKSSVNMDVNDTYMDSQRQFSAMRNLIREKKN